MPAHTLLTLPPEIIRLVLWWLSWDDIYNVKWTCHHLSVIVASYSGRAHPDPDYMALWKAVYPISAMRDKRIKIKRYENEKYAVIDVPALQHAIRTYSSRLTNARRLVIQSLLFSYDYHPGLETVRLVGVGKWAFFLVAREQVCVVQVLSRILTRSDILTRAVANVDGKGEACLAAERVAPHIGQEPDIFEDILGVGKRR